MRSVLACGLLLICAAGCQEQRLPAESDAGTRVKVEDAAVSGADAAADAAPSDLEPEPDAAPRPEPDPILDPSAIDTGADPATPLTDAPDPAVSPRDPVESALDPNAGGAAADAGSSATPDAPTDPNPDAGVSPVEPTDAGTGPLDSGTTPQPDAGPGASDSGPEPDASTPEPDAGSLDAGPAQPTCSGPPGLFQDDKCQILGDGLVAYHPQYPLWSDGAAKERYIYLPAGTKIDTSNPDRWAFPQGTRFYKTFAAGTLRVETRVMVKNETATGIDSWTLTSYAWSADQRSVSPASANGVVNALGTGFDIPSQAQCRTCHNMTGADAPIGFNAIQLNHSLGGVTLADLLSAGSLRNGSDAAPLNVSTDNARIPGDALAQAALGYLHGNCGHCHGGPSPRADQRLWSTVGMTQLSDAPIFESAVCECLERWTGRTNASEEAYVLRVSPGHAAVSGIVGRMSSRTAGEQMPPLGTKQIDTTGLAAVKAWIASLDGAACDASPLVCTP